MAMLSVQEALQALLNAAHRVDETEILDTMQCLGRVLAQDVQSGLNVPSADNTQMDGYAVRAADCASGAAKLRVSQRIPAGCVGAALEPNTAARIFTGAMIPQGADAVVMQEQCTVDGDSVIIKHTPQSGEWVRRAGEDIQENAVILQAGTRLNAAHLGLAASVGCATLNVRRRLKVAVFFTGDELAMPGEPLKAGAIYNSNRFTLNALLQGLGCEVQDFGIVPDSFEATCATLRQAAQHNDIIVTSGGVSVGEEDHIKPAVEAEGSLNMWQIAVKPGKPLAFGTIRKTNAKPAFFLGLPGNPVSSFVTFLLFVRPFILRCMGVQKVTPQTYMLRADFAWPRADKRQEYLRVRINQEGGLDLFSNQSSGVLSSCAWGTGLVENPPSSPIVQGQLVKFIPFSELQN